MISYRQRQCPLRKPRIWLWALAVILPGHILAAYALNWHRLGQSLVACPFPTPMRVALVAESKPEPATPQISKPNNNTHTAKAATKPAPTVATPQIATQKSQSLAQLEPAAGPQAPSSASPAIIGIQSLGFLTPPTPPAYPARSRARGEEGTALLLAHLKGQGGLPESVKLEQSSGFIALDTAALNAAKQWRFNAPHQAVWVRLPVRFALEN